MAAPERQAAPLYGANAVAGATGRRHHALPLAPERARQGTRTPDAA